MKQLLDLIRRNARRLIAAGAIAGAVAACADLGPTINRTAAKLDPVLQSACNDALAIVNIAGLVPGVGGIVPYINAGCATAEGITKLASDPSSTQWIGQMIGTIRALASFFGVKIPVA